MQMRVVACLEMREPSECSAESPRRWLPETVLSRRGLFTGKGKWVIFTVSTQYKNDTSITGSKRRRRGLWIHLDRSCREKVVRVWLQKDLAVNEIITFRSLTGFLWKNKRPTVQLGRLGPKVARTREPSQAAQLLLLLGRPTRVAAPFKKTKQKRGSDFKY
jgi:hypothetical protein